MATSKTAPINTQRGNRCLISVPRPLPVTVPRRADDSSMPTARGSMSGAIHSNAIPWVAPTWEYVAIAEGSSFAAPVTIPGPSRLKLR